MSDRATVAVVLLFLAAILFAGWMATMGPCELYGATPIKDVPARCI